MTTLAPCVERTMEDVEKYSPINHEETQFNTNVNLYSQVFILETDLLRCEVEFERI